MRVRGGIFVGIFILSAAGLLVFLSLKDGRGERDGSTSLLIYNRIPKTGSTSLMQVPYKLCKTLGYRVLFINLTSTHYFPLSDQIRFARNVSNWKLPAIYHGHFPFLDLSRLGVEKGHLYINLIRRPLDRLVSYYYFLRYGDDFRKDKIRSRSGDTVSFDECVSRKNPDCDPKKLWFQIPWFCGHFKKCSEPGSRWALEQAKFNVVSKYFLVGLTEELDSFVDILEKSLPEFFAGAGKMFRGSQKRIRKTKHKDIPSEETLNALKNTKVWRMENEFYEFVASHFRSIKADLESNREDRSLFHYQKIRP